jgi:hypothetical protein
MKLNKILLVGVMSLFVVSSLGEAFAYGGAPEQSSANNFTVEITSDNQTYSLGDSVVFSGTVGKYDEKRSLRISVFDSSSNLVVTQKTIVNPDYTFTHTVELGEKFSDGKHVAKAQYGSTKATVAIISFEVTSGVNTSSTIPEWVKNSAGWWAEGSVDDDSFIQGLQFLIKEGLMEIPTTQQSSTTNNYPIPDWIKTSAGWWAEGSVDDDSFIQGIQFLIKEGLMIIS